MELPDNVSAYVRDQILSSARPFCFLIDADYSLIDTWGDAAWCELDGVQPGADMREVTEFLVGLPLSEQQVLRFVRSSTGAIAHVHLVPDGGQCYVVLLDAREEHDATQLKQQSMNELRLMHARQNLLIGRQRDLITELVETRSELDHHRKEAERASENKSRFIAGMSHEFRTPLASIINYTELAKEPDADGDVMRKSLETIERSARHLTSLVDALLDDAGLAAGHFELQEHAFDCYELFADVAAMMAPMAAEKGLSFATLVDPDVPALVRADEVRLRQILINLLSNSIKFTVEGNVQLLASFANSRLVITVTDTGPGISVEDQERVFQAFERGSGRSETGLGLGLTITLRLVQLMGGECSLDSTPGDGCTVSVHVPVGVDSEPLTSADAALPNPGQDALATVPVSVLVCDDDEDMLALIEHYLHRSGYGLITASDSSEAIAKTMKFDPDLVLMDCNLPGIGGVDAARLLRRQGFKKPIVALTASALGDAEKNVFTRFFRKPAPMQELLGEVKRLTHP